MLKVFGHEVSLYRFQLTNWLWGLRGELQDALAQGRDSEQTVPDVDKVSAALAVQKDPTQV